ncbi:hypothetical protein MLD38_003769 [Melastoma candidum]|uniref:Uncharacterized protein n=1 Tax=Melastoma candidum TaxID=119954 RepID=A0ACB9S4B7_9MYRT|nr:hypothetical protein MLD38_003769 [Melastoma candidum]
MAANTSPYDKHAKIYAEARPVYPSHWYEKLAALTSGHGLAWDAGTGSGQAAVGVAEHYDRVVATDISEGQLKQAIPNPKVRYVHAPESLSEDEFVALVGGEGCVDLVIAATAAHWFNLPKFYAVVNRVLRRPGGVIAVWTYTDKVEVNPEVGKLLERFRESIIPYWGTGVNYVLNGYRGLPFPFNSVGLGSEGAPAELDMPREMSFEAFVRLLRTSSAYCTAKNNGVELLPESLVKEFEAAWGGPDLIRTVNSKTYMLAGTPRD